MKSMREASLRAVTLVQVRLRMDGTYFGQIKIKVVGSVCTRAQNIHLSHIAIYGQSEP